MTETVFGELQIDRAKGIIWFNSAEYGGCILRIQNIPEKNMNPSLAMIDLRMPDED